MRCFTSLVVCILAYVFNHQFLSTRFSQIQLQSPFEDFQQHLEADFADCRVIPPFAQLVSDEGMLCSKDLVEREVGPYFV